MRYLLNGKMMKRQRLRDRPTGSRNPFRFLAAAHFAWLLSGLFLGRLSAQSPVDNPIVNYYQDDPHADDYLWTEALPWERVFDLRDYGGVADADGSGLPDSGTDNTAAFQAAVEAAQASGGGVVYLPAGGWYFANDLYLAAGVIVRGDPPEIRDAREDGFAPPTRLEFPRYVFDPQANGGQGHANETAFKAIRVADNANAGQLGLVWLEVNRAAIKMSADGPGTGRRLVFGVRSNNVAEPQSIFPV